VTLTGPSSAWGRTMLLEIADLHVQFQTPRGKAAAVDGASLAIDKNEIVGVVGESGSGKSVTCLAILGLLPKNARVTQGSIAFEGVDLTRLRQRELRRVRGREIAMILQDPMTSLNPVFSIGDQLRQAVRTHRGVSRAEADQQARDLLVRTRVASEAVGSTTRMHQYPHQLSGGLRQRVVGAIALAGYPRLIIADEPTTALDVTVQAQYLSFLYQVHIESGASILLVTHDFAIVRHFCQRVVVMYSGQVVETGLLDEVFEKPQHPYTEALLGSVPRIEEQRRRLETIPGQPPSIWNRPIGCRFAPRCKYVMDKCVREDPPSVQTSPTGSARCWLRFDGQNAP
jgi:peptide/nickel transport system ATP-binding protein